MPANPYHYWTSSRTCSVRDDIDIRLRRAACKAERLQPARAVDMQQREVVLLVLGETLGTAVAGDRDRETAIGDKAIGDDRTVVADDDSGAVFDRLARRRSGLRSRRKRVERARHRDHDRLDRVPRRL